MFVAVSRESAEDYLQSVTPKMEINPSKYFEYNFGSVYLYRFTSNVHLIDFYTKSESTSSQAVAVLAGLVNMNRQRNLISQIQPIRKKAGPHWRRLQSRGYAGAGFCKSRNYGMVVFDGDKMVVNLMERKPYTTYADRPVRNCIYNLI